jgi:drug/metabolite transporter (DMT)-like permease
MVGSAFFFSLMSLFVKLVGGSLPSQEIVLVRGIVTLAISYFGLRALGVAPGGNRTGLLALRGTVGFLAVSAFFYGVIHLPLAEATVIHYTNPVFTAVIAAIFLAEPIRARDAGCLLASLAGVALIARPAFLFGGATAALDPVGVAAALSGAVLAAAAYVMVRRLAETEHELVIVLWFGVLSTLGAIPATAVNFVLPTGWLWAGLVAVGITTHIAQLFLTRGLALVPAGRAMTISYVQIVFAALWGVIFFEERPDGWLFLGAGLIVASTLALSRHAPSAPEVEAAA